MTTTASLDTPSITEHQTSNSELIIYIVFEVLIAVLALFNNTFVIVAVCKFKHLRTRTYTLLACLAFADIGVAVVAIPSAIVLRIGLDLSDGNGSPSDSGIVAVDSSLCLVIVSTVLFLTQVSIFNLLIIAVDRFVAIYYSLRYRAIVTRFRVKMGIAGAWIFGALIGFLPQFGWYQFGFRQTNSSTGHCAFEEVMSMDYMVYFNFFACVLPPLVVMFVLYILVFRSAKLQLRKIYSDVKIHRWKFSKTSLASVKDSIQPTIKGAFTPILMRLQRHHIKHLPQRSRYPCVTEMSELGPTFERRDTTASEVLSFETTPLREEEKSPPLATNSGFRFHRQRSSSTPMIPAIVEATPDHKTSRFPSDSDLGPGRETSHPGTPVGNNPSYNQWMNQTPVLTALSSTASSLPRNVLDSRRESSEIFQIGRLWSDASSVVASRNLEEGDKDQHNGRKLKRKSQLLKKEFRAARSLCTVVGVFAMCWLPLHVINCVTLFCPACYTPPWLKDFAILLSHANSLVNPIIYAFQLRDMKHAFQTIVKETWNGMTSLTCCRLRKSI